jgi:hypothetical protein
MWVAVSGQAVTVEISSPKSKEAPGGSAPMGSREKRIAAAHGAAGPMGKTVTVESEEIRQRREATVYDCSQGMTILYAY